MLLAEQDQVLLRSWRLQSSLRGSTLYTSGSWHRVISLFTPVVDAAAL